MFFIWKIEYILFFFSLNCKGWTFIFLWALLFLLVTVAGISSLVSNDFSVLRKTDDLLDVRGRLKHFQLSIFNNCSFFDLFSFFLPVLLFPLLQVTCTFFSTALLSLPVPQQRFSVSSTCSGYIITSAQCLWVPCTCTLGLSERTSVGMYVSFKDKRNSRLCLGQMYVPELTNFF